MRSIRGGVWERLADRAPNHSLVKFARALHHHVEGRTPPRRAAARRGRTCCAIRRQRVERLIALASASASAGCTVIPASPSRDAKGTPNRIFVFTTGVPQAIASS
jgi:hypothetical protein